MKSTIHDVQLPNEEVDPIAAEKQARRQWAKRLGNLQGLVRHLRGCPRSPQVSTEEQRLLGLLDQMIQQATVMVRGTAKEKELLGQQGFEQLFVLVHDEVIKDVFAFSRDADVNGDGDDEGWAI